MTIAKPDEVLTMYHISTERAGKILVGGSIIISEILKKASDLGVKGIVVSGIKRRGML